MLLRRTPPFFFPRRAEQSSCPTVRIRSAGGYSRGNFNRDSLNSQPLSRFCLALNHTSLIFLSHLPTFAGTMSYLAPIITLFPLLMVRGVWKKFNTFYAVHEVRYEDNAFLFTTEGECPVAEFFNAHGEIPFTLVPRRARRECCLRAFFFHIPPPPPTFGPL